MALTSALTCETKLGEYTFGRGLVSMLHRQTGCRSISTMSLKVAVITKVLVAHLTCAGSSDRDRLELLRNSARRGQIKPDFE